MRRTAAVGAALAVLGMAGCAGLPESGPVEAGAEPEPTASTAPFDFNPPAPAPGASRTEIVAGFLRALLATPVSTRVAEEYLTADAVEQWHPDRRTVVYADRTLVVQGLTVSARLGSAFELDRTGRWSGGPGSAAAPGGAVLDFGLVREDGEWRISSAPDAMVIPRSHFATRYREYALYFFDPTGSVLVPEQVYLPWGVQAPTLLVAGLLRGPSDPARGIERSFFPRGTRLGVGVPVRADGIAEVPLSRDVLGLDEGRLELALAQLAWTLRQVGEVDSVQVTVEGTPLELPGGGTLLDVTSGAEHSPAITEASTDLFGLRGGRIVQLVGDEEIEGARLPAVLGGDGAPRSLGVAMTGQRFAVVPRAGDRVLLLERQSDGAARPRTAYVGTDVLQPLWDRTDRLWLVDRTAAGPRVMLVEDRQVRAVPAPGLAGREVTAAALSRDGTRFAVAVALDDGRAELLVSRVVRQTAGRPLRLTRPRPVSTLRPPARVQDVGWRDPTTLAALVRRAPTTSEVVLASADGSSELIALDSPPDVLFAAGATLATSPDGPLALMVGTGSGHVHALDVQGRWDLDVVPEGLRLPTFVG